MADVAALLALSTTIICEDVVFTVILLALIFFIINYMININFIKDILVINNSIMSKIQKNNYNNQNLSFIILVIILRTLLINL